MYKRQALSQARPGDVVELAGKGHETYQEINGVQYHLDEREVVTGYFRGQREGAGKKQGQGTEKDVYKRQRRRSGWPNGGTG